MKHINEVGSPGPKWTLPDIFGIIRTSFIVLAVTVACQGQLTPLLIASNSMRPILAGLLRLL